MADRIIPAASLSPVASPVDRFVSPLAEDTSGIDRLAESLAKINPKLQGIIDVQRQRRIESEEAKGIVAADVVPSSVALNKNREGWKGLVSQVRKDDKERGTDNATALVGASPHFQRGLVKAKAQRLGLGLANHLQMQWANNEGGIKSIDNPEQVQAWVEAQTAGYSETAGVDGLDPLIVAEVFSPRVAQAQEAIMGGHATYRAKARVEEFANEFSANVGMLASGGSGAFGAGSGASSVDDWMARMTISESGGDSSVINSEGYGGWLQFGQARLDDYNNAHGTSITVAQFVKDEALQTRVGTWHVNDIDKHIQSRGYLARGYSLDGLRAVAHLGGKGGMDSFVSSGGRYDPADSNGTRLSAYYQKFAGSAGAIQAQADEAVANGVAPDFVNKTLVASLVEQAKATRNPAILDSLDTITTGNGPLGNIAWVREERRKAEDYISDAEWQEETREYTRQERSRSEERRAMASSGFATIMRDPDGEHTSLIDQANAAGEGELAIRLHNLQRQLQGEGREVVTDHGAFIELRSDIYRRDMSEDELADFIVEGTASGKWTSAQGASLFDDLEKSKGSSDFLRDPQVRNWIDNATSVITEKTTVKDVLGNIQTSGRAVAMEAEMEITEEILMFLEDNPEASEARVRKFVRTITRDIAKQPEYSGQQAFGDGGGGGGGNTTQLESDPTPEELGQGVEDPFSGYTVAEIEALANQRGIPLAEFIEGVRAAAAARQ